MIQASIEVATDRIGAAAYHGVPIPTRMLGLARDGRGCPVPYVSQWSAERHAPASLSARMGHGQPLIGSMYPPRQRECMLHPRCQGCGYDLQNAGYLWMITGAIHHIVDNPPACRSCLVFGLRICPVVLRGFDPVTGSDEYTIWQAEQIEVGWPLRSRGKPVELADLSSGQRARIPIELSEYLYARVVRGRPWKRERLLATG